SFSSSGATVWPPLFDYSPNISVNRFDIFIRTHIEVLLQAERIFIYYYDFVNDWRIAEFKKLVAEDTSYRYTLDVLADLCGFSSRASFSRSFKKNTGITPNEPNQVVLPSSYKLPCGYNFNFYSI
ncbi:AraC family transcriptional regulator, partial [Proteiniphilum sp. X52]|uniref:AraC family transcriptional regulator n=1 Tax=Proteiniphilum sp. X52 TaxID=2382159 RepID=UPI000F0A7928